MILLPRLCSMKKHDIYNMNEVSANIIPQFKSIVQQLYGDKLSRIILFGSYARGEQNEDSDIDFVVVLKGKDISVFNEIEKINNSIYDMILKTGKMISFIPVADEKFETSPNFFYSQVKKQGISV